MDKKNRFILLDLVRAIAIVFILIAHVGQAIKSSIGGYFGIRNFYYVSIGGVAVTIFLILSGLVLELRYGDKQIRYYEFIQKRIYRMYPIYYMSLIVGIFMFFLKGYHNAGNLLSSWASLNFSDLILSVTGYYAFAGKWGGPFIATSWYIGLIITLYFLYPFLSKALKFKPHLMIIILFLISVFSRLILGHYEILSNRPLDWFPLSRIFEFSLGIYLANVINIRVWQNLYLPKGLSSSVIFVSEISFPLFLVHYPFCFIIPYLLRHGSNQFFAISIFLAISISISWIILGIDKYIPRNFLIRATL